jgi:TPR repeat protein
MMDSGRYIIATAICIFCSATTGTPTVLDCPLPQRLSTKEERAPAGDTVPIRERWFNGDSKAAWLPGTLTKHDKRAAPDEYESFHRCRRAALRGLPDAQFLLGLMYFDGIGVTQDNMIAMDWFEKAALQGHGEARQVLQYVLSHDTEFGC